MRRYRMGLIQTAEQLRFSYQSIIEGAEALGIDMRTIPPYEDQLNEVHSSEESDSSDYDESISEEESEEDDSAPPKRPRHNNLDASCAEGIIVNDLDGPPPPIPPRNESLNPHGNNICYSELKHMLNSILNVKKTTIDLCLNDRSGPLST